jgi:hypothetical protein
MLHLKKEKSQRTQKSGFLLPTIIAIKQTMATKSGFLLPTIIAIKQTMATKIATTAWLTH